MIISLNHSNRKDIMLYCTLEDCLNIYIERIYFLLSSTGFENILPGMLWHHPYWTLKKEGELFLPILFFQAEVISI